MTSTRTSKRNTPLKPKDGNKTASTSTASSTTRSSRKRARDVAEENVDSNIGSEAATPKRRALRSRTDSPKDENEKKESIKGKHPVQKKALDTPSKKLVSASLQVSKTPKTPVEKLKTAAGVTTDNDNTTTPTKDSKAATPNTPASIMARAKSLFHRSSTPSRLVGRVQERATITEFLETHLLTGSGSGASLYVSGVPGTGKTALTMEILKSMESRFEESDNQIQVVFVNCMTCKDPKSVYTKLYNEIAAKDASVAKLEGNDVVEKLETILAPEIAASKSKQKQQSKSSSKSKSSSTKPNKLYLAVLDEIDSLLSFNTAAQETLYRLFEWPTDASSRFVLVGIANALDLTERFLPRLKTRGCDPKHINFNPYSVDEMANIIKDRLLSLVPEETENGGSGKPKTPSSSTGGLPGSNLPLMHPKAVELAARRVAGTGDVRKALEVCRHAIESLESTIKTPSALAAKKAKSLAGTPKSSSSSTPSKLSNSTTTTATTGTTSTTLNMNAPIDISALPKVSISQIIKITSEALETSGSTKLMDVLKKLSIFGKALVITCHLLLSTHANNNTTTQQTKKSNTKAPLTMNSLFELYNRLARNDQVMSIGILPRVSKSDFRDALIVLETQGILSPGTTSFSSSKSSSSSSSSTSANSSASKALGGGGGLWGSSKSITLSSILSQHNDKIASGSGWDTPLNIHITLGEIKKAFNIHDTLESKAMAVSGFSAGGKKTLAELEAESMGLILDEGKLLWRVYEFGYKLLNPVKSFDD